MLRISKLADYATIVMVYLARLPKHTAATKAIAAGTHLQVPTTSKLLKLLVQAELLVSQRGSQGGYALARPADDITVLAIIQAVEGEQGLTECSHTEGICALQPVCLVTGNWQLINRAVEYALDSVTLAEFANPNLINKRLFKKANSDEEVSTR